jgi:kynurenine formamidase
LTSAGATASRTTDVEFPQGRVIDLTHPFDETTIFWPTENDFQLLKGPAGYTDAGYYYAANRFVTAEHGGTHVDAPIHFREGRQTVDQLPLERLIGPAIIVDVHGACAADRDYQIGINDLRNWETEHGRVLSGVILLLRTGYAAHWPDRLKYLGTDVRGSDAVAQLHFPGLHPDAAGWLVDHRAIKAVGIDTASIDHGQSKTFASHVKLFEYDVPVLENVAIPASLPEHGLTVVALPMKIGGGTGGPTRIVAIVPDE